MMHRQVAGEQPRHGPRLSGGGLPTAFHPRTRQLRTAQRPAVGDHRVEIDWERSLPFAVVNELGQPPAPLARKKEPR